MSVPTWLRALTTRRNHTPVCRHKRQLTLLSLEHRTVPSTFTVLNTNDSGPDSFRQAILDANANLGVDVIAFNIPGVGVHSIAPQSDLPFITDSVVIDGYTQPGSSVNTLGIGPDSPGHSLGDGTNAALQVELNGSQLGPAGEGLTLLGIGSTVRGLVINGFGAYAIWAHSNGGTTLGGHTIAGNFIGTDATGTVAKPNAFGPRFINAPAAAVLITSGDDTVGGTNPADRNLISGNGATGLVIAALGSLANMNGTVAQGNLIGTNATGTKALGNDGNGVRMGVIYYESGQNEPIVTIGGTSAAERNIISGNLGIRYDSENGSSGHGIVLEGNWTAVEGNFVGTDVTGTVALANAANGVSVRTNYPLVGGTDPGAGNLISGNNGYGISVGDTLAAQIQGNLIGTDYTGTLALGNSNGIFLGGPVIDSIVGGSEPGAGNTISGNREDGFRILAVSGLTVQGNFIGTDTTGMFAVSNRNGIDMRITNNCIFGGTAAGAGNVISGNRESGIAMSQSSSGNEFRGNLIGTDKTGVGALGNTNYGMYLDPGSTNVIGAITAGSGNVIAFNGGAAIKIYSTSVNNAIRGNSIYANGGRGIHLGGQEGVVANDPGDGDFPGAFNNMQNFPVLANAVTSTGTTIVSGGLNSTPNTSFALDFYANTAADPSGYGEGERYLSSATVTTNGSGDVTFSVTLASASAVGEFITATATDPDGNTSEFAYNVVATEPPNSPPTAEAGGAYVSAEGQSLTLDASNSHDPDAGDSLTYSWDVNGDNTFGDATGVNPTLTWAQLNALAINDGPHAFNVSVRVDDGHGHVVDSSATTLTVDNVAPMADIAGPDSGQANKSYSFTLTANDPSPVDQAAGFTFSIDWDGDGVVDQTVLGPNGTVVNHSFGDDDSFDITVTATDKDLATSMAATHTIDIGDEDCDGAPGTAVIDGNGDLVVTGTTGKDQIRVTARSNPNVVKVRINHHGLGTFTLNPNAVIHVCGLAGNDEIRVGERVVHDAVVDGGDGCDKIWGGGRNDTLNGDAGDDQIHARLGNDVADGGADDDKLWGGQGNDMLFGGAGDDELRGGGGCDMLDGAAGDDKLIAGAGGDTLMGGDGDDVLKGGKGCDRLYGGAGDDSINGSDGSDVILGGDGNDLILGGGDRDLLIGGDGADRIEGIADEDILIAGTTAYDANQPALLALLTEWTSPGTNASRIANIQAGAGLTLGYRLIGDDGLSQTVFNDNWVDVLTGGAGIDWFFANRTNDNGGPLDTITDMKASELWSDTDF